MNTTVVQQPPTFIPPPQNYMPAIAIAPQSNTSPEKEKGKKINIATVATIAFFILSNPFTYRIVNQVFTAFTGKVHEIITETGAPTMKGHFLHTVIFFVVMLYLLMSGK